MKSVLTAGLSAAAMMLAAAALAQEATPPGDDQLVGQQFHITADSLPLPEDAQTRPSSY